MKPRSLRLPALALALLVVATAGTAAALPEPPGTDGTGDPRAVVIPSFTESPNCGGPYGIVGPYASHAGTLSDDEPVLGPWGDFFGRSIGDVRSRLVEVQLPGDVTVWVHERVLPALQQVIENLEADAAAGRVYEIRSWDTWSFNPVTVPPGRRLSFHAVGAAIDINSTTNPYRADNVLITDMPAWFVRAWTDAGWCWGGDWSTIKDPMHFSWRGPLYTTDYVAPAPTPALTQPSGYQVATIVPIALGPVPPHTDHVVGDVDRDGAPDVVRLRAWTAGGHLVLESAIATHDHETCEVSEMTTRVPSSPDGHAFVDYDGDARPDLWAFDGSSGSLRIEIYDWASEYAAGPALTPPVVARPGVRYLAGDHNRDGRTDLYVVRPGRPALLEIWAGPEFTELLVEQDLEAEITVSHRLALGDADLDGAPDLYMLEPGDAATLRVASGADGFEIGSETATGIGAHAGRVMHVTDYDGDGRDDLVFVEPDGAAAVYFGGISPTERDPASWFSASWASTWEYRDGCLLSPGFETEDGFGEARLADATGPGAAFTYPNPATGIWTVADLSWSWWRRMEGRLADLEPVDGPYGSGYGALLAGESTSVELITVDGNPWATIPVAGRSDPVDLAVLSVDGETAVAVAFGTPSPRVVVRRLDGTRLATYSLRRLDPAALLTVGDVTGDGSDDLLAIGMLPSGRLGTRVVSVDDGVVATQSLPVRREVLAATLVPATASDGARAAVLLPHPDGRATRVLMIDAATGEKGRSTWTAPARTGTIATSQHAGSPVLIVAVRHARTGEVLVEGRDPDSRTRHWRSFGSIGFDPVDADVLPSGLVLITGHRYGDGNIEVSWWEPASGTRTG